jgi:outer membrane receptor for ferrienterochelin and colicins
MKTIVQIATLSILFFVLIPQGYCQTKFVTDSFKVYGNCQQCKDRIEHAVHVKGVKSATWSIETKMLSVTFDSSRVSEGKLHQLIAAKGHDTDKEKAKDEVYNKLPSCCLYERPRKAQIEKQDTTARISVRPSSYPQFHSLTGVVVEETNKGALLPVTGAAVFWMNTTTGTVTDTNGVFSVPFDLSTEKLIVRYPGYKADTILTKDAGQITVILKDNATKSLKEVVVTARQASMFMSTMNPISTQIITSKELLKAACCNLSESFETNPSVDVSYSDAITGAKQIQVLGLSGIYTQLITENLPGTRGIASSYGLSYIPGSWIESIQVTKGIGSVGNGYESIAGQINVELKKPENSDRLFFNTYLNEMGRTEFNLNLSQKISSKWSSELLMHTDFLKIKSDENHDGFMDIPIGQQFNGINRWKYGNNKGLMIQFGVKALVDERIGGQLSFDPNKNRDTLNGYGVGINTKRLEGFGKIGYVFPGEKYKSIGFMVSALDHEQHSYFGLNTYDGTQHNLYANLIYQSIINNTNHKFRVGTSFLYDGYNETFNLALFKRTEIVPGAFGEYTFTPNDQFSFVIGLREDYNNLYGNILTPRLHLRYTVAKNTILRLAAGRGERTANIFAENISLFASSRQYIIIPSNSKPGYGLDPEVAWNEGASLQQNFRIGERAGSLNVDFYRTDFENQVVLDLDKNPQQITISNLKGPSFSNSFQAEFNQEVFKGLDLRLAYRWFNVQATYHDQLLERPLIAQNRALANLSYETKNKWKIDCTLQWYGRKRLPSTASNPEEYRLPDYSPSYAVMNAQITKSIKMLDLYIGVENLTDFRQNNLIIDSQHSFSPYFDASIVWGPVLGRMVYGGLRYRIR